MTIIIGSHRTERLRKREVVYRWRNPDAEPDANGNRKQVTLEIHHDADRKRFMAVLRESVYRDHNGYEVTEFALFGEEAVYEYLPTRQVARYSPKALLTYEAETLALLNSDERYARWHALTEQHATANK